MSDQPPITANQLAELRTEIRAFIESANPVLIAAATKEDVQLESDRRRRTVRRIVAGGVLALLVVVGIVIAFRRYDDKRNKDTARVCVTFANAHNGLVTEDEDTLQLAIGPSTDPRAQQFLTDKLAKYEARRVNADDCTP